MKPHILYVDDESIALELIARILSDHGYVLSTFECPAQALDWAQTQSPSLDLLITDQSMPAFSGSELALRLRQLYPDLPTIVVTGFGLEEYVEIPAPVYYLEKPYKKQDLIEVIETLMRGET